MRKLKQLFAIVFVRTVILIAITSISVALGAETQPFMPVRGLTTWYTDRTPIDIEIVGSSSMLPESHHLEPERTPRFRLERAYVDFLIAKREPGFEFVHLSFDMETGLPSSLFFAVANKGKFHENIENVPVLSNKEMLQRTLLIWIRSDSSATELQKLSERNRKCAGAPIGSGLRIFDWKDGSDCFPPTYPKAMLYVADYSAELAVQMQCREESYPGFGCSLRFPFENFAIELSFHRDHLED